ncbi:hypothetical protein IG193_00375 [Infirmifilum lucidum]|uniref:Uncharacterized protein n=1 Tax=Infirmifilum lucidum TaxID=2776706 RepID=A0A7L9FGW0_9CREN|nr:hypothetical protein [Infirmifilum lucidum]QOJ78957.1 hypothetical protein IG193_00375 [Infirmifilum lucidum]
MSSESSITRLESYLRELIHQNSQILGLLQSVRDSISGLRKDVQKVDGELLKIDSSINRMRNEVALRLLLTNALDVMLDYAAVKSRLEALTSFRDVIAKKLKEVEEVFVKKYQEIISDYLDAIRDYAAQFARRAQGDFKLLKLALDEREQVRTFYDLAQPEYVDPELLEIVTHEDIKRRIETLKEIREKLAGASTRLEKASGVQKAFKERVSQFLFPVTPPDGTDVTLVLLPVVKVVVEHDSASLEGTTGPLLAWEKPLEINNKLVSFASSYIDNNPVALSQESVHKLKQMLLSLARDPSERRLIEEWEIRV